MRVRMRDERAAEELFQSYEAQIRRIVRARPTGRRLDCNQEIGVRLPGGPLNKTGSWSKGKTSGWQSEDPSSIPGGFTHLHSRHPKASCRNHGADLASQSSLVAFLR